MKNKTKLTNINSCMNSKNNKALLKAELLSLEIKQNVEYNLWDDGFKLI